MRITWCFSLTSMLLIKDTDAQTASKSVSAAIFSKTKGERCVLCFAKQLHECFLLFSLCIQWFQGTSAFYFSLLWHGRAWQFLTCVRSRADTEMERRDKGPTGSRKVTAKLQESMSMALGLTECISKGFGTLTVHSVSLSGSHSFQNIPGSDWIRGHSCLMQPLGQFINI